MGKQMMKKAKKAMTGAKVKAARAAAARPQSKAKIKVKR